VEKDRVLICSGVIMRRAPGGKPISAASTSINRLGRCCRITEV